MNRLHKDRFAKVNHVGSRFTRYAREAAGYGTGNQDEAILVVDDNWAFA